MQICVTFLYHAEDVCTSALHMTAYVHGLPSNTRLTVTHTCLHIQSSHNTCELKCV